MISGAAVTLPVAELRVGHYVYLDLKWFEHPFSFNHFKIRSEKQLDELRALGLKNIRVNPELSEPAVLMPQAAPQPVVAAVAALPAAQVPAAAATPDSTTLSPILQAKRAMMARMREQRAKAERVENAFVNTVSIIRNIEKSIYSQPKETLTQATRLVQNIADSILSVPELAIQVMGDKMGGEDLYFHSLNVTMLALMMARDLRLPPEVAGVLGLGALLHDIGRKEVPAKILLKTEPLTQAERGLFEMHCQFGVDIGRRMQLAPAVLAIIGQHHECADGSGYPAKLKGEVVNPLARLVVIADRKSVV